jgi:hypothetical protein
MPQEFRHDIFRKDDISFLSKSMPNLWIVQKYPSATEHLQNCRHIVAEGYFGFKKAKRIEMPLSKLMPKDLFSGDIYFSITALLFKYMLTILVLSLIL